MSSIKDGIVVTLGKHPSVRGAREINASGRLVLAVAASTAIAISSSVRLAGVVCADDFYSATVAAAFGGTTTVIPFAAQHRGQSTASGRRGVSRTARRPESSDRLCLPSDHTQTRRSR